MASIEQLVSEIAHSVQQANSIPVRRAIRLAVIHNRNKLIRQSFERHNYIDKVLQQRFRISLIPCPDGDINTELFLYGGDLYDKSLEDSETEPTIRRSEYIDEFGEVHKILRSKQRVPRPTRLDNNLPFLSVRTTGVRNPIEIPFVKEAGSKYYRHLPGMCKSISYDYINQYIYLDVTKNTDFINLGSIIVESPFEYPTIIDDEETVYSGIQEEHFDGNKTYTADDEFMISEDMIYDIKKLVLDEFNSRVIRETNEVPTPNLMK